MDCLLDSRGMDGVTEVSHNGFRMDLCAYKVPDVVTKIVLLPMTSRTTNPLLENVYVINLACANQRMKRIQRALQENHITGWRRVDGVHGKTMPHRDVQEKVSWMGRTCLCSRSMIGCALSHMKTWQLIVSESTADQNKWHLVMEDDTVFKKNTLLAFDKLYRILAKTGHEIRDDVLINLTANLLFDSQRKWVSLERVALVRRRGPLTFTGAYLLTTNTARRLLAAFPVVHYHIDFVMYHMYDKVYHTNVSLFANTGMSPEESYNVCKSSTVLPLLNRFLSDYPEIQFVLHTTLFSLATTVPINGLHVLYFTTCVTLLFCDCCGPFLLYLCCEYYAYRRGGEVPR